MGLPPWIGFGVPHDISGCARHHRLGRTLTLLLAGGDHLPSSCGPALLVADEHRGGTQDASAHLRRCCNFGDDLVAKPLEEESDVTEVAVDLPTVSALASERILLEGNERRRPRRIE
jgi:hypothetical protein